MGDRLQHILNHISNSASKSAVPINCSASLATIPNIYRYSRDNGILTEDQRQFYEENGFLVIRKIVDENDLDRYREEFGRICKREVSTGGMTIMRDVAIAKSEHVPGEQAVTKVQNFQDNETLFDYCCLPKILDYAESFIGPDIMAMHTMLINKPPDPGSKSSRHPMHQDLHYFPFRPADNIVCSWTAMQHVHRKNGCLVAIPGSHKHRLLEHGYPEWEGGVNKMYHGIKEFDPSQNEKRVHLEMFAGDTVFFHPLLIHGSGMNKTEGFRKSISSHYAASNCEYIDVEGTTHESVAKEVAEVAFKKHGVENIQYKNVWQFKGRLVRGKDGILGQLD